MKVRGIEVEKKVGESSKFRVYLGSDKDGKQVILKVAKTFEDGDVLAKEASQFNMMRTFGDEIASMQESQEGKNSHYDWLFAKLLASFMDPAQGDRRINMLAMPDVDLARLVPLAKLHRETKIDARTSVWILGRFFKFYSFFELLAAANNSHVARYPIFSSGDYLIEPERHRLIYYNFSGDEADVIANNFIKEIARFVVDWVAAKNDQEDQRYLGLIKDFSENGRDSFEHAHGELYHLANELWGIKYYPFTYCNRGTYNWKTIEEAT